MDVVEMILRSCQESAHPLLLARTRSNITDHRQSLTMSSGPQRVVLCIQSIFVQSADNRGPESGNFSGRPPNLNPRCG